MLTRRTCSVDDCVKPPLARGLCGFHYRKWRGKARLPAETRLSLVVRTAMAERGVTVKEAAAAIGIRPEALSMIRFGHVRPSHDTAIHLSEFLMWPEIAQLSEAIHARNCEVCGRRYINRSDGGRRRYCTKRCLTTASVRRNREKRGNTIHLQARRFREATEAIAKFCGDCEWDGVCKTPDCALRAFSPLPLARTRRPAA